MKTVDLKDAKVGDAVSEASIPEAIRKAGGGWINGKYVCRGCHKDGYLGWKLLEIRRSF